MSFLIHIYKWTARIDIDSDAAFDNIDGAGICNQCSCSYYRKNMVDENLT